MAKKGKRIEGGSGGKKGHSNMSHWDPTEWVKARTRRLRRAINKKIIRHELDDAGR